jgi:hypothetical protein
MSDTTNGYVNSVTDQFGITTISFFIPRKTLCPLICWFN